MHHWPLATVLLLASGLAGGATGEGCAQRREPLSAALQQARLQGDKVRQSVLEEQLLELNAQCRGLTRLQPGHASRERASRLVERREAELRGALAGGDARRVEDSKRRLDQARQALQERAGAQ
ncbi:DUF1090 family protein [Pseudomonas oligotrophica]|uniref:DUF1090 family protein n=1 Tax=Pseudomonas oligotrophica TaxID=2912055 RepID=UPI001F2F13C3|nr:DUF1090 family protein [Pseudomonas oligotrophica]MCF7201021.1 DUF1090 domain-containing protein [Pseudomonas oligotrophica]